jgi:hypothetical protein
MGSFSDARRSPRVSACGVQKARLSKNPCAALIIEKISSSGFENKVRPDGMAFEEAYCLCACFLWERLPAAILERLCRSRQDAAPTILE